MVSEKDNKNERDTLFASPDSSIETFSFDENVAKVFDDMIHRSVPGYDAIVSMIGVLAERYVMPGTCCYDLGCSLGAVTFKILENIRDRQCRIVAVDNSEAMINKLRERLIDNELQTKVDLLQKDIRDIDIANASMVVLNFVLQFLEPDQRTSWLRNIYDLCNGNRLTNHRLSLCVKSGWDINMGHGLIWRCEVFPGYR